VPVGPGEVDAEIVGPGEEEAVDAMEVELDVVPEEEGAKSVGSMNMDMIITWLVGQLTEVFAVCQRGRFTCSSGREWNVSLIETMTWLIVFNESCFRMVWQFMMDTRSGVLMERAGVHLIVLGLLPRDLVGPRFIHVGDLVQA
jgi:hypothetical protein